MRGHDPYQEDDYIEIFTDASTERENPVMLASWFNLCSRIVNLANRIN